MNPNGHWKGNDYSDEKGELPPGKKEGQDGECCVEKRSTQRVMQEHRMKRSTKSRLRSADRDWGLPKRGWGGKECGIQYMSDNPVWGAPVGNEERRQANGVRNEKEEHQSRLRSTDGDWGEPIIVVSRRRGYQAAQSCLIDECRGFRSKVYHKG